MTQQAMTFVHKNSLYLFEEELLVPDAEACAVVRHRNFTYAYIFLLLIMPASAYAKEDVCSSAFVPCPRARGFQFFNKTCYAVIHDQLPFSEADAGFKCESGMHLALTSSSEDDPGHNSDQHTKLDRRMTLARATGRAILRTLTSLLKEVVKSPQEKTLIGLSCSADEDCSRPESWTYGSTEADVHVQMATPCATIPFCNWVSSPSSSGWSVPPGSKKPLQNRLISPPESRNTTPDVPEPVTMSGRRVAVLKAPTNLHRLAEMTEASAELELHSVACELPYPTTDDGIDLMIAMGLASESDMALTAQLVTSLEVSPVEGSLTRVRVIWGHPVCAPSAYYVITELDGGSELNRTEVAAQNLCVPFVGCQIEVELPPCVLVYIRVGAILKGTDAADSVVEWQTPPLSDPGAPLEFYISDISGPSVTLSWKSADTLPTCQPFHKVTVPGHGEVTVEPGQVEVTVHLGDYCTGFDASVQAVIMERSSAVRGPIRGFTGPKAPSSVEVLGTGETWSQLRWSWRETASSSCVLAKFRVTCQSQPINGQQLVSTAERRQLNVSHLQPGTRYTCAVCALALLTEAVLHDATLAMPPCGEAKHVQLQTLETIPGPPHGLAALEVEHTSVKLKWRKPIQPNGIILRYVVSADCEQHTFPLCPEDPQCRHRQWTFNMSDGNADVASFTIARLQAARRYNISVAAATSAGRGNFSHPLEVTTAPGVPSAPQRVVVTPGVKVVVGEPESTTISVSLQPPCPYPGLHGYRLLFEKNDFLSSYRSTVRSSSLSRADIEQLYAGRRNITFSVFDGKWTPGFQYRVRMVALSNNPDLGDAAPTPSDPVSFTMTVPPPGPVQALLADCSTPLKLSFSWTNPTEHAFGLVSYTTHYRCRQLATGQEVGGRRLCHQRRCPCQSSLRASDQCRTCERVCNYPVKSFHFRGVRTYYFNCSCLHEVPKMAVAPGSLCRVSVQAVSKYHQQLGSVALASCRSQPHVPKVTDLSVENDDGGLVAYWYAPKPRLVPTKAYHVMVKRIWGNGTTETLIEETIQPSQCDGGRCRYRRTDLHGDVTYQLEVAAESVYAVPAIGPRMKRSFTTPPRVPRPPSGNMSRVLLPPEQQYQLGDPTRQFCLKLPANLYDSASGKLREVRLIVMKDPVSENQSESVIPASGDDVENIPFNRNWRLFSAGQTPGYRATPPGFIPSKRFAARSGDGTTDADFVLGNDLTCREDDGNSDFCNGPLQPNTSYTVRVVTINGAGFAVSAPALFRTRSVSEVESHRQVSLTSGSSGSAGEKHGDGYSVNIAGSQRESSEQTRDGNAGHPETESGSADSTNGHSAPREPPTSAVHGRKGAKQAAAGATKPPLTAITPPADLPAKHWTRVGIAMGIISGLIPLCSLLFCLRRRWRSQNNDTA